MLQVKRRRPGEQLSQVPLGGKQSCREARERDLPMDFDASAGVGFP